MLPCQETTVSLNCASNARDRGLMRAAEMPDSNWMMTSCESNKPQNMTQMTQTDVSGSLLLNEALVHNTVIDFVRLSVNGQLREASFAWHSNQTANRLWIELYHEQTSSLRESHNVSKLLGYICKCSQRIKMQNQSQESR